MTKIDRRITYYLTIDTETANTFNSNMRDALVYDIGLAVHDKRGHIYETHSLVIADIYCGEREIMKSAYYANKLPKYEEALRNGERKMVSIFTARKIVHELLQKYNIKAVIAHNARFDHDALNNTLRYITKSKYRYFMPYNTVWYDSLKMAQSTICKQKLYQKFCETHSGYLTKFGKPRATAEILYQYMTGDDTFKEEHQGLDDVLIEIAITTKCMRQHKPMRKLLFNN